MGPAGLLIKRYQDITYNNKVVEKLVGQVSKVPPVTNRK